ncbi:MAG TPA: hypothetical protein VHT30_04855 [Acidimicrobiales bacterium]|jgi:hypothetical protein|nr:hypothetical protein [Acidimicrobiales bacterium]
MTVTIRKGTARRVVRDAQGFTLQVAVEDPSFQTAAEAALTALRRRLLEMGDLDGQDFEPGSEPPSPNFVSEVVPLRRAPFIYVDAHSVPRKVLAQLPESLEADLKRAGVENATIGVPRFNERNIAARARLLENAAAVVAFCPSLAAPYPSAWLDAVEQWLLTGVSTARVGLLIGSVTLSASEDEVGGFLRQVVGTDSVRVAVEVGKSIRVADFSDIAVRRMILGVGTPPGSDAIYLRENEAPGLVSILEMVAVDESYGYLSFERNLVGIDYYLHNPETIEGAPTPLPPSNVVTQLDSMLFDAFPAQIVGPVHREHLADLDPGWFRPVSSSRDLLIPPDPLSIWIPESPKYIERLRDNRRLLASCFVPIGPPAVGRYD